MFGRVNVLEMPKIGTPANYVRPSSALRHCDGSSLAGSEGATGFSVLAWPFPITLGGKSRAAGLALNYTVRQSEIHSSARRWATAGISRVPQVLYRR